MLIFLVLLCRGKIKYHALKEVNFDMHMKTFDVVHLNDDYCGKNGLIFILIFFNEYHDPFQFIHTTPSSVPCFAISQLYCPPQ